MNNLEKAKHIIRKNIKDATCGIFNCRNTVGDHMETLYPDNDLVIDICYDWAYFEVFGLTEEEFIELEEYYEDLIKTI